MSLPSFRSIRFSCPNCNALAHQHWYQTRAEALKRDEVPPEIDAAAVKAAIAREEEKEQEARSELLPLFRELLKASEGKVFKSLEKKDPFSSKIHNLDVALCDSCREISIWLNGRMVHPTVAPNVTTNSDMPVPVKVIYDEAAAVVSVSPKSAAALLRLALQTLLRELGEEGKNIHDDIDSLFQKGLSPSLAKVMHSLRIIGNESVHPGTISVDDKPEIAGAMFRLLNEIVEQLISRPREQAEIWDMLPESKRKAVEDKIDKMS